MNEILESAKSMLDSLPTEDIQLFAKEFTSWTKDNPVVGGVIGVWVLGVLSYWARSVPNDILRLLNRYLTVTVNINNDCPLFFHAMKWFHQKGYSEKARTLRANNGRYDEEEVTISPGYGSFTFWHRGWPYRMSRYERDGKGDGTSVKEYIEIKTLGFRQGKLRRLLEQLDDSHTDDESISIIRYSHFGWGDAKRQPVRHMDTVVAIDEVKQKLINSIENFVSRKDWYQTCGIPYRMGIAIHGVPGTGKSSMALALCSHFKKKLHILSLAGMTDSSLLTALSELDSESVVLIEDIDTFEAAESREDGSGKGRKETLTLSGLLNAIDGVVASHGRILIMTTNHLDHLDPALRRPGRCDIVVEMGCLTNETAHEMFNRFWPDFRLDPEWEIAEGVTPAQFQGMALQNLSQPDVLVQELQKPLTGGLSNGTED